MKSVKLVKLANHFRKLGVDPSQITLLSTMSEKTLEFFLTIQNKDSLSKLWYFYITNQLKRNQMVDSEEIFQIVSSMSLRKANYATEILGFPIEHSRKLQMIRLIARSKEDIQAYYAIRFARNCSENNIEATLKIMQLIVDSKSSEHAHYVYLAFENEEVLNHPNFFDFAAIIANADGKEQSFEAYQALENGRILNHPNAVQLISYFANSSGPRQAYFTNLLFTQDDFLNQEMSLSVVKILSSTKLEKCAELSFQLILMYMDQLPNLIPVLSSMQTIQDEMQGYYVYSACCDEELIGLGKQFAYAQMFANVKDPGVLKQGYRLFKNDQIPYRMKDSLVSIVLSSIGEVQAYYAAEMAKLPEILNSGYAEYYIKLFANASSSQELDQIAKTVLYQISSSNLEQRNNQTTIEERQNRR